MSGLFVGTSGYSYKGWHERFYPQDLKAKDLLPFYAERYNCVEINSSFYRIPSEKSVAKWLDLTPSSFQFCFKISRYITHQKRLKDCADAVTRFMTAIVGASDKKGPLLLQLSPLMKPDYERLDSVLEQIQSHSSKRWQIAVECRGAEWYQPALFDVLQAKHAALVLHDKPEGRWMEDIDAARFVYVRFHGPRGDYGGKYGAAKLKPWAKILRDALAADKRAYAFFNNDRDGFAVEDAALLRDLVQP